MNILEIEDVLKGLPDQALMQEAQQPTGQVPQFLVVSEIQRRSTMRQKFEAQKEQPSETIKDQILSGGIASVSPPPDQMMSAMGMPQQMPPQQMPPQQPPMPQQGAPMPPPMGMAGGGVVKMANGEMTPFSDARSLIMQALQQGIPGSLLAEGNPKYAGLIDVVENEFLSGIGADQYVGAERASIPYGREFDPDPATVERLPPLNPQGQISRRALPQADAVGPAAPTIDTRAENLIFNQPRVAEGFEKSTPELQALIEAGSGIRGGMQDFSDNIIRQLSSSNVPANGRAQRAIEGSSPSALQSLLDDTMENIQGFSDNLVSQLSSSNVPADRRAQRAREVSPPSALSGILGNLQNFFSLTPEQEAGLRGGRIAMESPGRLLPKQEISSESIDDLIDQMAPVPTGSSDVDDLIDEIATGNIVTSPRQGSATQDDAIKLNLDTATTKDNTLLEMAIADKSITDFAIDPERRKQVDKIIGDRSELLPRGVSDIQTQGIKPELVAPSFAKLLSEQERRLEKIREDTKRDIGAQALIQLGAGIAAGDVAGGIFKAGDAVAKARAAERAAEADITNLQTRIRMAEEQGKFDVAKALRAEATEASRFEKTMGFKEDELAQTLEIAQDRIKAERDTEKGRELRAEYNALSDLAQRLQTQLRESGIPDPATVARLNSVLNTLQNMLGIKVEESDRKNPLELDLSAGAG